MLNQKVIVIIGGAGLIGREFVKTVINNKGIAIIADIDTKIGEKTESILQKELNTNSVLFVEVNMTSRESLDQAIEMIDKKYGRIDSLVNNAYPRNKNYGNHFFDVTYEDFSENVSRNLGGCFLACQRFAEYFKKQGHGNIVNIASIYGSVAPSFEIYQGTAMTVPIEYSAVKSALIHLTRYMAKYLKGNNIRVNSLSPGGISDNQPDSFQQAYKSKCLNKGMLDVSDLSGTLLYLLSEMSEFTNGQNFTVDDGFSL